MKRLGVIVFGIVAVGLGSWGILMPKYEYHHYNIEGCQEGEFTVIVYSKIGERGLILAKGIHKDLPPDNYIIDREFSGFDTYFDAVATCERNAIEINYHEGYFDPAFTAKDIVHKRVDYETYDSLKNSETTKHIYLN